MQYNLVVYQVNNLSQRRPGFVPRSVHVGFVVDKVALGQVSFRVLPFSPVSIIPPYLSILILHTWKMDAERISVFEEYA
jgi:hypothetical protein